MDARAYTHKPRTFSAKGIEFEVKPLGMGEILAEGEAMAEEAWYDRVKKMAALMETEERLEFFSMQMEKKPIFEANEADLEQLSSPAGLNRLVVKSVMDSNGLTKSDAEALIVDAQSESGPETILDMAELVLGGLLSFAKKATPKKKPVKRKPRAKAKAKK